MIDQMKTKYIVSTFLLAVLLVVSPRQLSSAEQTNFVFFLVDDLGYGDFSFFNKGISETPFLDQFIQESTCLSQHYTSSPVCNPSPGA